MEKANNMEFRNIWENIFLPEQTYRIMEKFPDPVIFFLLEGSLRFTINDTDVYTVDAGEMALLPEAIPCKIEALKQSSIMKCALSIESLLVKIKLLEEVSFENANYKELVKTMPVSEIIKQFLLLLRKCMKKGLVSYYFLDLKRNELNLLLFACYEKKELTRFFQPFLSKDIQFKYFVLNNYLKVKNVQELAILANYSASGFIKKFQKIFDESPYQWMQKQKAAKIQIDISRGVKSLQEIANEYKFSSYQHFSVFCKTMLGFSPTDIRQQRT